MEIEVRTYEQMEEYLLGIPKFAGKNTLENTRAFLKELGDPQKHMKIIHIAGTNGKGSVCAYLCALIREMGYTVGSFTSPHLVELRERIQINRIPVEKEQMLQAFFSVSKSLKKDRKEAYHPSFFEFLFFMAMVIFDKERPDYVILETGLGGRLDATNSVEQPLASVITRIGMDHMQYLGDTIEKIAGEKAGIIKPGIPVVYDGEPEAAAQVIEHTAQRYGAPCFKVSKQDYGLLKFKNKSIDFSYHSRYYEYVRLTLDTVAFYQMENASVALKTAELLFSPGELTPEKMRSALYDTHWEGRMEEVLPDVYLDGAHNEDGVRAFLYSVGQDVCSGKRFLLFGAVKDKEYTEMLGQIQTSGLFDQMAAAVIHNGRSLSEEELRKVLKESGQQAEVYQDAAEAFEKLFQEKHVGDRIYIAGSLYLVGELKSYLRMRGSHD